MDRNSFETYKILQAHHNLNNQVHTHTNGQATKKNNLSFVCFSSNGIALLIIIVYDGQPWPACVVKLEIKTYQDHLQILQEKPSSSTREIVEETGTAGSAVPAPGRVCLRNHRPS